VTRTIRPRPGDLEAATTRHPFVPSGEYVGSRVELCDLCGLSITSQMHQAVSEPEPPVVRPTVEDVVRERDEAIAEAARLRGLHVSCDKDHRYSVDLIKAQTEETARLRDLLAELATIRRQISHCDPRDEPCIRCRRATEIEQEGLR